MKQGKTEKAVFAKLSTEKVELEEHKVELSVDSEINKLISRVDNSRKTSKDLLNQAQELASSIGKTLYRAQVNISGDAQDLKKVDSKLGNMYKELKGYNKEVEALFNKLKSAEKELGSTREIDKFYKKLRELQISISSGTVPYGQIGDRITQRLREAEQLKKI